MPFPLSSEGELQIDTPADTDVTSVVRGIEAALLDARASSVDVAANRITFRAGIFRAVTG
ncbi:MAG: hypothetical protein H0T83_08985 [Chthoniobacterales bacterium]|nr:hypothetical protein [Chthoniobacterales bacterium]